MDNQIVIWGLAPGETRDYMEEILSTQCKTESDIEKIKAVATKKGYHSIRVTNFTQNDKPDFLATVRQ